MNKLFNNTGERLYLTDEERDRFIDHAKRADSMTHTFALTLTYTGARISEALKLTPAQVDFDAQKIVFETAKLRKEGVYRSVPITPWVLDALNLVHNVHRHKRDARRCKDRLWPFCRQTMWRRIKNVMREADIEGPQATPHGLRHAFAANAVKNKVSISNLQEWMGHTDIQTTLIYSKLFGEDEREMYMRMWRQNGTS